MGDSAKPCIFCDLEERDLVWSSDFVLAVRDAMPVTDGHTLVIPRRHVATYFDASADERAAIWAAVDVIKAQLDEELKPDGYNVGFNAGEAAGQTVMHLHVHVIPRYRGDMDDPRGGVRYVIPSKGNYLRRPASLATGGDDDPFARHIFPLLAQASDVAIVAAFVQDSGLARMWPEVHAAIRRGARIRLLTGDYLGITQVDALQRLYDWQQAQHIPVDDVSPDGQPGQLLTRVVEVGALPQRTKSFHPKSWRFDAASFGVAYVGSSNISYAALGPGIEWNLRVDRDRDADAYGAIGAAFDALWQAARPLQQDWIDAYARRVRERPQPAPPGELTTEPPPALHDPHEEQRTALDALRRAREEGRTRALVVLATGLGKTLVSVLDYAQLWDEGCQPRPPRLLFLAHRRELLLQAAATFRTLLRERGLPNETVPATVGWFAESSAELHGDLVFASVAKLARKPHLEKLAEERFDYVVVDEVHHAAAASYRQILDRLPSTTFVLGLTATPDRADGLDILGLFDDHVAHRAGIDKGIALGRLVPFHYFGVKDDIDYANTPWRNRGFVIEELARAAQTEARMTTLWRAWQDHPGERSLVFCCSIAHADFVRDDLERRGVRAIAIHSGPDGADRSTALDRLDCGELDAICAVDIFNEGIDLPAIDRVVMLRPTESSTIFLQQLGRGLRADEGHGKRHLTVIDFVGNHRIFLQRLRGLLSLGSTPVSVPSLLENDGPLDLPDGCSVDLELEAKEVLARLFKSDGATTVERAYRELAAARGEPDPEGGLHERPTAGELQRMGYPPARLRERHGGWFGFVRGEGHLLPRERRALAAAGPFLAELEITAMTKSFKMVTLHALLEADSLFDGLPLDALAIRAHAILRRDPRLLQDVPEEHQAPLATPAAQRRWRQYWRRNPIKAWTTPTTSSRAWFTLDEDHFRPAFATSGLPLDALVSMVAELVDYR
ncbi:MAG: DEAD/DEAH box helicase family protein, partial [Myxococcales bacterium]|nr:DEAD/DEAH box helicase family protein [Myxococcales bacterium]